MKTPNFESQAGETNVRAETLQAAAELLVLRRDTFRIIDGAGPSIEVPQSESTAEAQVSEVEAEQVSSPVEKPESPTSAITERTEMVDQTPSAHNEHTTSREAPEDQKHPIKPTKCTFSGVVPIDLSVFQSSGIALVECPVCASTRTLEPRGSKLKFFSHDKRKTHTSTTSRRWMKRETAWELAGEESTGCARV